MRNKWTWPRSFWEGQSQTRYCKGQHSCYCGLGTPSLTPPRHLSPLQRRNKRNWGQQDLPRCLFNPMTFVGLADVRPGWSRPGPRGQCWLKAKRIQLLFWLLHSPGRRPKRKEECPWLVWSEACQEVLCHAKDIPQVPLTPWYHTGAALSILSDTKFLATFESKIAFTD